MERLDFEKTATFFFCKEGDGESRGLQKAKMIGSADMF